MFESRRQSPIVQPDLLRQMTIFRRPGGRRRGQAAWRRAGALGGERRLERRGERHRVDRRHDPPDGGRRARPLEDRMGIGTRLAAPNSYWALLKGLFAI